MRMSSRKGSDCVHGSSWSLPSAYTHLRSPRRLPGVSQALSAQCSSASSKQRHRFHRQGRTCPVFGALKVLHPGVFLDMASNVLHWCMCWQNACHFLQQMIVSPLRVALCFPGLIPLSLHSPIRLPLPESLPGLSRPGLCSRVGHCCCLISLYVSLWFLFPLFFFFHFPPPTSHF